MTNQNKKGKYHKCYYCQFETDIAQDYQQHVRRKHPSRPGQHPYIATQFADKFGFLNIEISNGNPHTNMTGAFYNNEGSTVHDYFTIEKEIEQG